MSICLASFRHVAFPLLGLLCASCCSGPPYQIDVGLDEGGFKHEAGVTKPVEVDLVPFSKQEMKYWDEINITDYYTDGTQENRKRLDLSDAKLMETFKFSPVNPGPFSLSRESPLWQKIETNGFDHMAILADLPGRWADKTGPQDTRRLIIPIDCDHWNESTIKIRVLRSGLQRLTRMLDPD